MCVCLRCQIGLDCPLWPSTQCGYPWYTVACKSLAWEHCAQSLCDHVPVIVKNIYFTSYNVQNQFISHIDHKRLRGFALKLCLLRGEQLYPCGNFVMGGYAACISEMFELLHPYHTSTHHKTFSLNSPSP